MLVFTYTVGAADVDSDDNGIASAAKVLGLPTSASITRLNDSTVAAYPGPIPLSTDFVVNPPPVITKVEVTSTPQAATDTYGLGEDIEFTVEFSEAVTVTGDVTFRFSAAGIREARLKSGNGTDELVFAYTVQATDDDDNGIFVLNHTGDNQSFNLGTVQSIIGVDTGLDAVLEHGGRGQEDDHKVDGSLTDADATLSALSLSGITLVPAFTPGTTAYTATTSLSSTTVTISISQGQNGATGRIAAPPDADLNESGHQVTLDVGDTTITVTVTSSNGDSTRTYTVTVTAGSANRSVPPPKNLRAVEEQNGVRLTWQPPDGTTVTGYRIERRRAGEGLRDNHVLVEDTGSADTGYTDKSAEEGVDYEYRVSSRNEDGPGEVSDWVRAVPEEEPVFGDGPPGAPGNLTITAGDREITLSWEPPADNGNPPATRYRIEWRIDGKDYKKGHWGIARKTTYTKTHLANGVTYIFRVKAENGSGNDYGPYGPPSEEVSGTPTSGLTVDLATPVLSDTETLHHGMVRLDWQDVEDAGWYVVQYYHVKGGEWLDLPAEGVDIAFHGSSAVVSNLHGLSWLRVGAMSCAGASEWSQIEQSFGTKASDWEGVPVPEVAEGDEIEPCPVVLGTPVLSEPEYLHHGMVRLDWQDIEDAGWYVVQYYHVKSGEWLDLPTAGVDIAFHGSSAVVSDLHGLSWLRVRAVSCAGESEWSQIEQLFGTNASDWEGVPVPEVAEGDEIEPCDEDVDTSDNSPATGAPTISGTVQVGETLTANTSGIADADGLANATFSYQWLAVDTTIAGATGSTHTLADADESKAIKVRVSFTDDADNEETLTSAATAAVAPMPNSPATGAPTISGTAQVGKTLTVETSGIADADGLANATLSYQWLADNAAIAGETGSTYTLTDSEESKAVKVRVSFTDDGGNEESLTSAATDAVAAAEPTEPPPRPTGLSATATHDQVVLTWDDPGDDSVTGYVILRRHRYDDPKGQFSELVADTGTAAATYTDDTVAAGTSYTYRIKAINEHGVSERSRWFHIDIPAAPEPAN